MKSTLFFVLGLLVLASATSSDDQAFAQIENHPFGQTMLDLVQINMQANEQSGMKSEDLMDQIVDLCQGLLTTMVKDKKEADYNHKSFQLEIENLIDSTNKTLLSQKAVRKSEKSNLIRDERILQETETQLEQDKKHLASVKKQIVDADSANTKAIAAHEKKIHELLEAIQACKEANQELAKLNSGVSFVQVNMQRVKGGMQKVENVLKLHLPARLTIFKPIISALVDMKTNADPLMVKKVVGLINQLRSSLESEQTQENKSEKSRIQDYIKSRSDLVDDKLQTNNRIGEAQDLILTLEAKIKHSEEVIKSLNVSIPANEQLLAIKITQSDNEQKSYTTDDAIRVDEVKVMNKLIDYLQKSSAKMSTYMKSRVTLVQQRQI